MNEHERVVRGSFIQEPTFRLGLRGSASIVQLWGVTPPDACFGDTPEEAWEEAWKWREERLRAIAEVREEIDSTQSDVRWFAQGVQVEDCKQEEIHRRILSRLQAALADLERGMVGK